jgi:hypothetical protein
MRRSWPRTTPRFGSFVTAKPAVMSCVATGKLRKPSTAYDRSLPERAEPPVAVGSRALTPQAPGQTVGHPGARIPGKAQGALPSSQSGAAAAEYGSRHKLLRASEAPTTSPWSSGQLQRGAGSSRRISGSSTPAGLPAARPNPSLKLTRYGRHCKPGLRYSVHCLSPGLQYLPPRAA